ncbi:hypothetical protein BD770DRAFT_217147 [Pilaira anomala]|nr:hypothetical protein BD770DRAFT_217147 [Pilaira anomala]
MIPFSESIPSLSSSISSSENTTPRTSSSCSRSNYYFYQPPTTTTTTTTVMRSKLTHSSSLKLNPTVQECQFKRYSEPLAPVKRWDDSQLEMELAEDDLIMDKKKNKARRNSSLRFKQSFIFDKFRHHHHHHHQQEEEMSNNSCHSNRKSLKFTRPFKKLCDWLF